MPEIQLSQGTIEYHEQGSGPAVVLIHGALVNGRVWDRVRDSLPENLRCIVPELPLGSHRIPMNADAGLSPRGLAALIAELLERLELENVTLVGNDTGGALCQLVAAHHPERLGRLVLTNCDAFEHFPPPSFKLAVRLMRLPGAIAMLDLGGRIPAVRRRSMSIMKLTTDPIPDELVKEWMAPLRDRRIRRDLGKVLRGMGPEPMLAAAERLRDFDRPALIVWGMRDVVFPREDAQRLADTLPKARLERIEDSRTFVQVDRPERLAELVAEFVSEPAMT
jgi:pimeloyl-ACP methyl ester carboxylesterase